MAEAFALVPCARLLETSLRRSTPFDALLPAALTVLSQTLGSVGARIIGEFALESHLRPYVAPLADVAARGGWTAVLLARLTLPLPSSVTSFLLAALGAPSNTQSVVGTVAALSIVVAGSTLPLPFPRLPHIAAPLTLTTLLRVAAMIAVVKSWRVASSSSIVGHRRRLLPPSPPSSARSTSPTSRAAARRVVAGARGRLLSPASASVSASVSAGVPDASAFGSLQTVGGGTLTDRKSLSQSGTEISFDAFVPPPSDRAEKDGEEGGGMSVTRRGSAKSKGKGRGADVGGAAEAPLPPSTLGSLRQRIMARRNVHEGIDLSPMGQVCAKCMICLTAFYRCLGGWGELRVCRI